MSQIKQLLPSFTVGRRIIIYFTAFVTNVSNERYFTICSSAHSRDVSNNYAVSIVVWMITITYITRLIFSGQDMHTQGSTTQCLSVVM